MNRDLNAVRGQVQERGGENDAEGNCGPIPTPCSAHGHHRKTDRWWDSDHKLQAPLGVCDVSSGKLNVSERGKFELNGMLHLYPYKMLLFKLENVYTSTVPHLF